MVTDPDSKRALLALLGVLLVTYGGLLIYAVWFNQRWRKSWLFRARWRGGTPSSSFGATTQALFGLSLGMGALHGAFPDSISSYVLSAVGVSAILLFFGWIADLGDEDDT